LSIDKDIILSLGVHWYNRPKTLKECADELYEFLNILKSYKPEFFSQWYEGAFSKKKALEKKVEITYDYVKKHLSEGKYKDNDYNKYCYNFGVWNGNPKDSLSGGISASLGSNEEKGWSNNFIVDFPYDGPQMEYFREPKNLDELIKIMIDYWKPEKYQIRTIEGFKEYQIK
jgi:hypothetical protein